MHRLALGLALITSGCSFTRAPVTPMPTVFHAAPAAAADSVIVLLPGLGDGPVDYERHGIVAEIQRINPKFDVIAADAHFGYYRARTFHERLHTDVIAPLAGRYQNVWLAGISLGGFGSAIYAEAYPGTIDGIIALAPYMGSDDAIAAIDLAGGLTNWVPPAPSIAETDAERLFREMWTWYRDYAIDPSSQPKLYLGYGTEDRLAVPNGFVAAVLPADRCLAVPGGHKWTVWQPLFTRLAERALPSETR